jgi:WD40 repeat protein
VLIAGGTTQPDHPEKALNTAEIYTRTTDKVTNSLGSMATPRWRNAALTLLSGKVLVVGGACWQDGSGCSGDPTLGDVYDPATDVFVPTKPLKKARVNPRMILLPDGKVFVTSTNDASIELYDPDTNDFTLVANDKLHYDGFTVRLLDGRVLTGGGSGGITNAEIFDPDTGVFTSTTGPMTEARWWPNAHTLPDGRVFVIAGYQGTSSVWTPIATMESFDPKTGTFSKLPYSLSSGRASPSTALVRDGTVLVMGGYTIAGACDSMTDTVDQVDPTKGTVTAFAKLPNRNTEWNAVTLLDGSVLSVGGGACGAITALPDIDFLPGVPGPK